MLPAPTSPQHFITILSSDHHTGSTMPLNQLCKSMQNQILTQHSSSGKPSPLDIKQYFFANEVMTSGRPSSTPPSSAKRNRHFSYGSSTSATGYDFVLKIILLGDQGVGKSSYLKALRVHPDLAKIKCRASHLCDHLEVEVITSSGKLALVKLCDTGGQERYRSLTSSYYRGAHGAILMVNLNNSQSLENVEQWMSDLDTFCSASSCSRVLLGMSCTSPSRTIVPEHARTFAESRAMPYMEVDSTHYYNIVESIQLIVDRIVREVTICSTKSQVIKPVSRSEEELRRLDAKFVCLC